VKRTLIALVGMMVIGLGMASAQVSAPLQFTVAKPFYVESTLLPAGTYQVAHATYNINLLQISPVDGARGAVALTSLKTNATIPASSEVVFNQYGDRMFLEAIVVEGHWLAAEPLVSKIETIAAKDSGSPTQVAVRALPAGRS